MIDKISASMELALESFRDGPAEVVDIVDGLGFDQLQALTPVALTKRAALAGPMQVFARLL